ncbi:energy-coupling factor ABC transporter permease [Thalassolituus sp. LLYu03]|uniref:energy-coupling factor ABC transporter permease n=1 Tax=Thalassolituus sp. LLYu03 TaxID=3421656 RepID=UPI003D2A5AE6
MIRDAVLLPDWALWSSALVALAVLLFAIRTYHWPALRDNRSAQHFFAGSVVALAVLWNMQAGILPGLSFHLMGITAVVLLMGWRLALVVTLLMQVVLTLTGKLWWGALGYSYLLSCVVPVLFSYAFYLVVVQRLRRNPFVYILIAGFINAGLTHAVSDISQSLALWWLNVYTLDLIWHDYLRYLPLMMFPEGVVNGMFISGMVVFHTRWLSTFDEDSYFR